MYYDEDLNKTARDWFIAPEVSLLDVSLRFARFNPNELAQTLGEQAGKVALENAQDEPLELQAVSMHLGKAVAHMDTQNFTLAIKAFKRILKTEENAFTQSIEPGLFALNNTSLENIARGLSKSITEDVAHGNDKKQAILVLVTDFEALEQKKSFKP